MLSSFCLLLFQFYLGLAFIYFLEKPKCGTLQNLHNGWSSFTIHVGYLHDSFLCFDYHFFIPFIDNTTFIDLAAYFSILEIYRLIFMSYSTYFDGPISFFINPAACSNDPVTSPFSDDAERYHSQIPESDRNSINVMLLKRRMGCWFLICQECEKAENNCEQNYMKSQWLV